MLISRLPEWSNSIFPQTDMADIKHPRLLTYSIAEKVRRNFGTPVYVYDLSALEANASAVLEFPQAFGITIRYAMKVCPNAAFLNVFK